MPKWASGSAIRNVQMSFGSIEKNTFEPCRAREKSKNNFADVPRWPSLGHARFRKCRNGQESLEMLENALFLAHARRTGCRIGDKIVSMPRPRAPENVQKCVLFATFLLKHAQRKADMSLWSPKMPQTEPVEAAPKFRKCRKWASRVPRIEHNVSGQIVKNAWKHIVFATFRRKWRKASKSMYEKHKNDGAITETPKTL